MKLEYKGIHKSKKITRSRRSYDFNPVAEVENEKDIKFFLNTGIFIKKEKSELEVAEKIQCAAITKAGTQCKRMAISGSTFCSTHNAPE